MKLPAFLTVDPLAKFIAQKMRDEPDAWEIGAATLRYNGRIHLNQHRMNVEWPVEKNFNYVSREHLRKHCSELVLHHEKKRAEKQKEIERKNNEALWEAMLADKPKDDPYAAIAANMIATPSECVPGTVSANRPLGPIMTAAMNMPLQRHYENIEREQAHFLNQYQQKVRRYHEQAGEVA